MHKVALITGAGSGVGRASVILFAQEGASVTVAYCNVRNGQETGGQIIKNGGRAILKNADASKAEEAENMVRETVNTFGRIDILFNKVSMGPLRIPTKEIEENRDRTMSVNINVIFLGCKYAITFMKAQKCGVIINTASAGGLRPRSGTIAYCTSKGAVIVFTKAFAIELASFGIRVNCINPVATDTPMIEWFHTSGQHENIITTIPKGRFAKPEEIAHGALYLVSDESSIVTGVLLDIDGGRSI